MKRKFVARVSFEDFNGEMHFCSVSVVLGTLKFESTAVGSDAAVGRVKCFEAEKCFINEISFPISTVLIFLTPSGDLGDEAIYKFELLGGAKTEKGLAFFGLGESVMDIVDE